MSQNINEKTENNIAPETISNTKVWNYNGNEFEFDMTDADIVERYENVFEEMGEKEKALPKTGKHSEIMRAHYNWFVETFDKLFGEGNGKKICGEKCSLSNCYDAYESFLAFVALQRTEQVSRTQRITSTYLNRAQRRAANKK